MKVMHAKDSNDVGSREARRWLLRQPGIDADKPNMDLLEILPQLMPAAIDWAHAEAERAARCGDQLSVEEGAAAQAAGVVHPELVRIVRVDELPNPENRQLRTAASRAGILGPETAGLTLGYTIFVRRHNESLRLLSHELRHVHQFERAGSIAEFLSLYLRQVLEFGYHDAPLEVDARAYEICAQPVESDADADV